MPAAFLAGLFYGILPFVVSDLRVSFFFQAEDGIRAPLVTGVQTCALPISWLQDPGFFGDVCKSSVAVVVIQKISVSGKAAGPAHRGNAFPLANGRLAGRGSFFWIEFDVVAHEKIEVAITVVVEPRATGPPTDLLFV